MSGLTGTGHLLRLAARRDRSAPPGSSACSCSPSARRPASSRCRPSTQADLDRLARTAEGIGANPAVVALQGPAYDAGTYGGATAWQVVTPGVFLLGLMSMLLVTRHTRQEEETAWPSWSAPAWSAATPGWPPACSTCWRSTSCWPP